MRQLVAIDLPGGPAFLGELQRAWNEGDAVFVIDRRLAPTARRRLVGTMAPSRIVDESGISSLPGGSPVDEGDALVVATSGTTGVPRGVVLTHDAVAASARATTTRLGVDPAVHRWLACLPLNHVGGLSVVTRAVLTGTPLDVHPGFDPEAVAAAVGVAWGPTSGAGASAATGGAPRTSADRPSVFVSLVPTALRRVSAGWFHTVVLGGSAPPESLPANVVTTYGMTETGSGVVYDGVPLDGVEIQLSSDGEIRLRGPMLLRAYRDGQTPLDSDGWLRTGDAGEFDPQGRLVVRGRLSDLIISGGENVWPSPIEAVLRRHPAVVEVAVAGRPDPEWGQRVVAWIVPADRARPPDLESLRALVKEELDPWSAPRQLVLVESLPKTSLGKVQRGDLPLR